jgi:hypothetical protein
MEAEARINISRPHSGAVAAPSGEIVIDL